MKMFLGAPLGMFVFTIQKMIKAINDLKKTNRWAKSYLPTKISFDLDALRGAAR